MSIDGDTITTLRFPVRALVAFCTGLVSVMSFILLVLLAAGDVDLGEIGEVATVFLFREL